MKTTLRQAALPIGVAVAAIIVTTIVQAYSSDRDLFFLPDSMSPSAMGREALGQAAARVANVPKQFGEWDSEDLEVNPREMTEAHVDSYVSRRYFSQKGGSVQVFLVCGKPYFVLTHTPDRCWVGAGYTMETAPMDYPVGDHRFRTTTFRKENPAAPTEHQRIYWGFATTAKWDHPAWPTFSYSGAPYLYKVYVTYEIQPDAAETDEWNKSPGYKFLNEFLPIMEKSLMSPDSATPAPAESGASS